MRLLGAVTKVAVHCFFLWGTVCTPYKLVASAGSTLLGALCEDLQCCSPVSQSGTAASSSVRGVESHFTLLGVGVAGAGDGLVLSLPQGAAASVVVSPPYPVGHLVFFPWHMDWGGSESLGSDP